MALPIQSTPIYKLIVPSTGKEFKYRPFLVKEEKALLIAQQSEDQKVMADTLKGIIHSCAKSEIDLTNLATFDLEYIFTQLRSKSVGEKVELVFGCDEPHTGEDLKKSKVKIIIDLSKIEISKDENHTKKIELFDGIGVIMKYPTIDVLNGLESLEGENIDEIFELISNCIETIYTPTELFHVKEQTQEEVIDFLNNLTSDQFQKIQEFFRTMPKLTYKINYSCPVCKKKHSQTLGGLQNFF